MYIHFLREIHNLVARNFFQFKCAFLLFINLWIWK